jgi:hypothetical protein
MRTSALIQIPLPSTEALDPLPVNIGHYVAVLQSKSGEREALSHVSTAAWERLTPLVEVVGPKNPPPVLSKNQVADWMRRLWKAIDEHPFYLDILRLKATHRVQGKTGTDPVLARVYEEARKRRMRFVPVVQVGQSAAAHVRLVADAAIQDGHGVALRYRMRKIVPPAGKRHRDLLRESLDAVHVDVTDADLLVDLEFFDTDDELDADDLAFALRDMCAAGEWRCVVVLGTSIPKMLGGPNGVKEGSVGTIERREWGLWAELRQRELPRVPAFGDYAIQNPEPPADDIGGNTMRANIRYTATADTIVARGRGPVSQEGSEQYHDLCGMIVKRPEFRGPNYSWGDKVIQECAKGLRDPGSQPLWRGAGTSHHLQFVTDQVRVLEAQAGG